MECRIGLLACTATIYWIVAHIQYTSSKSCRLNSAMQDPLCSCFYSQFQIKNFALLFALLAPSFKYSPVVVISLLFQSRKSALYFGLVSRPNWLELLLFRPHATMQPESRLLSLPAELRLLVYSFIFSFGWNPPPSSLCLAPLLVCKQIHTEARLLAFSLTNFSLARSYPLRPYLGVLDCEQIRSIRHLTINFEPWFRMTRIFRQIGTVQLSLDTLTIAYPRLRSHIATVPAAQWRHQLDHGPFFEIENNVQHFQSSIRNLVIKMHELKLAKKCIILHNGTLEPQIFQRLFTVHDVESRWRCEFFEGENCRMEIVGLGRSLDGVSALGGFSKTGLCPG